MAVKTAGLFIVNSENKILIAHPTGHDFWSIPKGKIEDGESIVDAAIRETWEETNFDAGSATHFTEIEKVKYKHGKKILYPVVLLERTNKRMGDFTSQELKCNSIVSEDARWNAGQPEMDDWKWVDIDEAKSVLHYTQVACLDTVQQLIIELDGEKQS